MKMPPVRGGPRACGDSFVGLDAGSRNLGKLRYFAWRALAFRRRALRAMKPVASSWL